MSTFDKLMYGGFGFGPICFPTYIPILIITVIFPPLAVFLEEMANGFKDISKIIVNLILTSLFYFPGLIHALTINIKCPG
jgi:uncharacterized membrane protein YqaE (UPF0057 family)